MSLLRLTKTHLCSILTGATFCSLTPKTTRWPSSGLNRASGGPTPILTVACQHLGLHGGVRKWKLKRLSRILKASSWFKVFIGEVDEQHHVEAIVDETFIVVVVVRVAVEKTNRMLTEQQPGTWDIILPHLTSHHPLLLSLLSLSLSLPP